MYREQILTDWLKTHYPDQPFQLEFAAADADFRRYFRAKFADGSSIICMDAPPQKMSISAYLAIQKIFQAVKVPQIIASDEALGLVALEDLGNTTFLSAMEFDQREISHKALLLEAVDTLIELQKSSTSGILAEYDESTLLTEINLFPDWFANKELNQPFTFKQRKLWQQGLDILIPALLQQQQVFVHRDFIVRNLMLRKGRPGVLDFQDALYGPISYDIASLTRDAFIEWDEEFTLDIVIRYWEKAKSAGLAVPDQFDDFYRDYEWMSVQRHLKVIGIFARLHHRDGKDKYKAEIPRFVNYLRKTTKRYVELAPFYLLLQQLSGEDETIQTAYTF